MPSISTGSRRTSTAALVARQLELEKERQVTRKELGQCARDAMKALGLSASARLVLGELVGCFGETMIKDRILVWPSNEYLVTRTGMAERSVRYTLASLMRLGILTPKDSANGKRFAVRGRDRQITDAYGFDLTPLYARRGEWATSLRAKEAAAEELRQVFEEITICRRAVEQIVATLTSDLPQIDRRALENALGELKGRTPRRSASADRGLTSELLKRFRKLREDAEHTFLQAGSDGKACRHIESKPPALKTLVCKQEASGDAGARFDPSLKLILEACPALSKYAETPTDEASLVKAGAYLRSTIGAHRDAWSEAVEKLGGVRAAVLVAITLQIHDDDVAVRGVARIRNPGGYFRALVRKAAEGKYQMEVELMALRRRHLE